MVTVAEKPHCLSLQTRKPGKQMVYFRLSPRAWDQGGGDDGGTRSVPVWVLRARAPGEPLSKGWRSRVSQLKQKQTESTFPLPFCFVQDLRWSAPAIVRTIFFTPYTGSKVTLFWRHRHRHVGNNIFLATWVSLSWVRWIHKTNHHRLCCKRPPSPPSPHTSVSKHFPPLFVVSSCISLHNSK